MSRRATAQRELDRAVYNVDQALTHIIRVRNFADEADHPDIIKYLDKLGEMGLVWQGLIADFRRKL